MGEPGEGPKPSIAEAKPAAREIVGDRILGSVDPRTLTREQFSSSPDLLYHGAIKPFELSTDFDFENAGTEGSATFGLGFYTIDSKTAAQEYAEVRSSHTPNRHEHTPTVIEILPFQAKVLDLRAKLGPTENGSFPYELALEWKEKFDTHVTNTTYPDTFMGDYYKNADREYSQHLQELVKPDTYIHPRALLMTHQDRFMGPPWSKMFTDFMVEQGYDGAVVVEASESKKIVPREQLVSQPTYVFFNMEKIGTYDAWQKKK